MSQAPEQSIPRHWEEEIYNKKKLTCDLSSPACKMIDPEEFPSAEAKLLTAGGVREGARVCPTASRMTSRMAFITSLTESGAPSLSKALLSNGVTPTSDDPEPAARVAGIVGLTREFSEHNLCVLINVKPLVL